MHIVRLLLACRAAGTVKCSCASANVSARNRKKEICDPEVSFKERGSEVLCKLLS